VPKTVEILLTGGSCAGKTTALPLVSRSLREHGLAVLTAPEAVTLLVSAGIPDIGGVSRTRGPACVFQREVLATQTSLRESFKRLATLFPEEEVVVLLYDRGELDGLAYHPHDCLSAALAETGRTTLDVIHSYDAIMHLVTAADGAQNAFSSTNPARWDTAEEAIAYDHVLQEIYRDHPRHTVIDNSTDFIGKMERLVHATIQAVEAAGEQ